MSETLGDSPLAPDIVPNPPHRNNSARLWRLPKSRKSAWVVFAALLAGATTANEIAAATGISSHIASARLSQLAAWGYVLRNGCIKQKPQRGRPQQRYLAVQ